jgi:hypothetical protein
VKADAPSVLVSYQVSSNKEKVKPAGIIPAGFVSGTRRIKNSCLIIRILESD